MAWQPRTTCQQCEKKLSARDRALGTICTKCVAGNKGRVWGKDSDDDYTDGD